MIIAWRPTTATRALTVGLGGTYISGLTAVWFRLLSC